MNKRQILSYIIFSLSFIILSVTACKEDLPCDCVEENKLQCFEGICLCKDGWGGERCEKRFCGVHGSYDEVADTCVCEDGWYGELCENQDLCYNSDCLGNQACNEFTGECECADEQSFGETCESFYRTYGEESNKERISDIVSHDDGTFSVLKIIGDSPNFNAQLCKLDENGEVLWDQILVSNIDSTNAVLKATNDGGYLMMYNNILNVNDRNIGIIKTDNAGNESWNQVYNSFQSLTGEDIIETPNGYALIGYSSNPYSQMYLADLDSNGMVNWEALYGEENQIFRGHSITNVVGGGYMALISSDYEGEALFDEGRDVELHFINDIDGALIWSNRIEESSNNEGYIIHSVSNGYIIGGVSDGIGNGGGLDMYLLKTDLEGNKTWDNSFGTNKDEITLNLEETLEGNGYLLSGYRQTINNSFTDNKFYLVRTDNNGIKIWDQIYGGNGQSRATDAVMLADTTVVGVGYTTSYNGASEDGYLIKILNVDAPTD